MQTLLTSLISPVWSNEGHTTIDCLITTSQLGDELLPFTASSCDVEPHGRAIFMSITNGEYGPIGEYVPVAPLESTEQPTVTGAQTL
jgi:hypothetical protein